MPPLLQRRLLITLLGLAALAYVVDLGGSSIWDANEAFYVETPREMIERADYVSPTFNYEPRINKPVLSYWIVAGLYRGFGVSVGVERAAIAGSALVMIAAAFLLGRAASPHPVAPLLAALGLAANPRFFMFGRRILVDVLLAACMSLTLLLFAWSERDPRRRRLLLMLMYLCVGLGVLTKGPVAAALPALVFLAYLAYYRELGRIRTMMIPMGTLLAIAVVVPWYAALYQASGWEPIKSFFLSENFERYVSGFGTESRGPLFYLPVVFTDGLPWSLLLPVAAVAWFRQRRDPASADPNGRVRTLLWFWVVAFVGVFSLSGTKQDLYILPVATAVAVLGAEILSRAIDISGTWRNGVRWGLLVTGFLLALAGALVLYVFEQAGGAYLIAGSGLLAGVGIVGGVATVGLAGTRRINWAVLALAASLVAVNWTLVLRVLPAFEQYKPVVPLSEAILARAGPADRVVHYDVGLPSMVFYLRRHVETVFSRESFLDRVRAGGTVFAVMPEDRYEDVKNELGTTACVLGRQPTFDAKLREMLDRRPPPAIVLVGTPCPPGRLPAP